MEAPICALVDAMFRLPAKLDRLLVRNDHMLPRGAEGEIPLIKQDLEKMISILQEHDDSGAEDRAMMINCLIKEVRELSYDMEDSVDQYEHAADTSRWILSPHRKKYKITRCRGKIARRLPEKLKWRLWMANKIREFSMRSQEALQRYSLFNHPGGNVISSSTASTSIRCAPPFGSWHATPYGVPVGINTPLKKLEAWLDKDGEQKLKVVSLVGPGGIGKTMLANELYRRIGGQFECRAFVRTSRKPDVRGLLISMLSQVRPHQTPHTWKVHNLIADIRTHLQDKRYLIAIDDVWDTQTWDIISHALPDGNHCSGILVTTEIEDVSLKCCGFDSKYVFIMKSLGHDNSSKLFFNTTFGPKYQCPPELSEVANNIIRKCAGLPLAAVTVASLLVKWMDKPEQWDYVNKSLGYGLMTNPTLEGMKQVLNLSYNNLPQHLKACVMYLSIYQEDDIIQTDDLVKQWIAEGFIRATEDKDKEEISKGYFDELISSRMIQPVHMNDNDDVLSCTVHYVVLDFVRHKSIEENFVTAIDHCQTTVRLADKVRRLSLHLGNAEATPPTNMRLSQVRTLAFFGVLKCLPSIVEFRLLQVLSLHLWGDDDNQSINFDLTRISELFRLRYLHVKCNVNLNVQQIKMRALQCLETPKIDARVSAVPSDIVHLPGLLHLGLPIETNLPNGIGHMTSLRTIRYFDLSLNSTENVQSLGELTNLQDLRLTCSTVPSCYLKSKMDTMGSILAKLSNLRSLTLEPSSIPDVRSSSMSISCDGLSIISSALVFLRRFEWLPHICTFSSLPQWIEHLDKLCILKIGVTELARNDVDVLIGLPALTVLSLYVRTKPAEKIVFNNTGFSVLKYFKFMCSVPWVEFETDAMPNLRKLKLGFDAHGADQHTTIPVGIEKLSGLKEISAKIGGAGADNPDRTAAELALSYAIKMHPARPTFNIQHVDCVFTARDDYKSGLQEEEQMTLQKQYKIIEEDSNEQHQVLQKDSREGASTNVHRSTAKGGKRQRNSRYTFTTKSEVDHLEDGYRWRKYGKKAVKNSPHTRSYYRCAMQDCMVKKRVERSLQDPTTVITTYEGQHTHPIPSVAALRGSTHLHHQHHGHLSMLPQMGGAGSLFGQSGIGGIDVLGGLPMTSTQGLAGSISSVASATAAALTPQSLQMQHFMAPDFRPPRDMALSFIHGSNSNIQPLTPKMLPRWSTQVKLSSLQDIEEHDDGFSWMKYGQKDILGSKYPRSYYQCKHRHTQGCQAMKQLQRTDGDPLLFDAMYVGNHTCTRVVNFPFPHGHEQSSLSSCFKDEGSAQRLEHMPPRMPKLKTRMRQVMQVKVGSVQDIGPPDDGFSWRKYGEKDKVLGSKYPRAYFKCVQKGCPARKQVQRTDIDPLLFDVVYEAEHTCAQSAHSLSQRRQEQSSDSVGVNASPATSQSQVTYEISGSVAGVRFMSPAASSGEATCEEASGSTSKVGLAAPNSCQAASGSGSTTTGSRLVSPAMSASQVTYEVVSGSMAGSWSAPDEADSRMDDLLDLDSPVDDYAEEFYLNPVHEDLDSGLRAPPNSPESLN